jgi:hypothetical protein
MDLNGVRSDDFNWLIMAEGRDARGVSVERPPTEQEKLNAKVNAFIRSGRAGEETDEDR